MDNNMKDLYNSMSSAEKEKYQREMRKQFNEAGNRYRDDDKGCDHCEFEVARAHPATFPPLFSNEHRHSLDRKSVV